MGIDGDGMGMTGEDEEASQGTHAPVPARVAAEPASRDRVPDSYVWGSASSVPFLRNLVPPFLFPLGFFLRSYYSVSHQPTPSFKSTPP